MQERKEPISFLSFVYIIDADSDLRTAFPLPEILNLPRTNKISFMASLMEHIKYEEELILNSRGMQLFTCRWFPDNQEPKALIFICHGYAMECSISMQGTGTRLANAGYAVHGIDYEGHGKSSGLQGFVPDFDELVNDCFEHFTSICERRENKTKKRYLLGESMGGAVALHLHRKKASYWDGAVLVAPMCKIAEEMKPSPVVIRVLTLLSRVVPTWRIIPTEDIIDKAVKSPEWRKEIRNNPYCYKGAVRVKTGYELLKASLEIQDKLHQVALPFLIVHGDADSVTDPSVSQSLYESACSKDKTFKIYPGMWHALTSGEPQENIDLVFFDIIAWLKERTQSLPDSRMETEHKTANDPKIMSKLCFSKTVN